MSYDISIIDPVTKKTIKVAHNDLRGGTYAIGGTDEAYFNITFNYGDMFSLFMGKGGLHQLDGKKVSETIGQLKRAISDIDSLIQYGSGRFSTFSTRLKKKMNGVCPADPYVDDISDDQDLMEELKMISQLAEVFYGLNKYSTCIKTSDPLFKQKGSEYDFDDYWAPTPGNAKTALQKLLKLAEMAPDGIWSVAA